MQKAERGMQSKTKMRQDLSNRFVQYSVRIIRVGTALPKTEEGLHIRRQMLRSGTSAGADYEEARGGESRRDFIHKMQIVLKELCETHYWLRVIEAAALIPSRRLSEMLQKSDELISIVVKSLVTARGNASHGK